MSLDFLPPHGRRKSLSPVATLVIRFAVNLTSRELTVCSF